MTSRLKKPNVRILPGAPYQRQFRKRRREQKDRGYRNCRVEVSQADPGGEDERKNAADPRKRNPCKRSFCAEHPHDRGKQKNVAHAGRRRIIPKLLVRFKLGDNLSFRARTLLRDAGGISNVGTFVRSSLCYVVEVQRAQDDAAQDDRRQDGNRHPPRTDAAKALRQVVSAPQPSSDCSLPGLTTGRGAALPVRLVLPDRTNEATNTQRRCCSTPGHSRASAG